VSYEYLDDARNIRGPYSAEQIGKWLRARLLAPSRRVRAVRAAGAAPTSPVAFQPIASIPALSRFCLASDLAAHAAPPAPLPRVFPASFQKATSAPPTLSKAAAPPDSPGLLAPAAVGSLYFYLDVSNAEQGPFEVRLMRAWTLAGALQPSTPVRRQGGPAHAALSSFAELVGGAAAARVTAAEQRTSVRPLQAAPAVLSADHMRLEAILSRLPGDVDPVQAPSWPPPSLQAPATPPMSEPDYAARGAFNARTGRFVAPEDVGTEARGERLPWPEPDWEEREVQGKRRRAA